MPTKIELPYAVNEKVYLRYYRKILHVRIDDIEISLRNYGDIHRIVEPAVRYSFHLTCSNGKKKWRNFGEKYLTKTKVEALAKLQEAGSD